MLVIATGVLVLGILMVSLALGGKGSQRNNMASVGAFLVITASVLAFIYSSWALALTMLLGGWVAGSIGGLMLNKKFGGFNEIDNADQGSSRATKKLLNDIRKGKS